MARKILCVAEKPSIAKSVAQHLSGGHVNSVWPPPIVMESMQLMNAMQRNVVGSLYVRNYDFDFNFGPPWGQCPVTMTSVSGHLNAIEFAPEKKDWHSCAPAQLFDLPVYDTVAEASSVIISQDLSYPS